MTAPIYATCPATVITYDDPDPDPIPDPEPIPVARACGESLFLVTETNRDLHPDGTTEPPDGQQATWSLRCPDGHVVATPDWPDGTPVPSTSSALALALAHTDRAEPLEHALGEAYGALVRLVPNETDPERAALATAARDHARLALTHVYGTVLPEIDQPPDDIIEHAERWLAGDRRATPPLIAGLLDLVKAGRA